jgi:hypothetical protein
MKNIFKYLILPGLMFIVITSCDDEEWLKDVKIRSIDANDQWTSVGDLEMLVNGAYWHTSGEIWNDSQLDQGRAFRICASDIGIFIPTAGNGWELSTANVQEFYNRVNTNPENAASKNTWEGCY